MKTLDFPNERIEKFFFLLKGKVIIEFLRILLGYSDGVSTGNLDL